jgi:hypothetical protein
MEQEEIMALLEKYWRAETTLEEEGRLSRYFGQPELSADLEPFRALFIWREEEAQVAPGKEFDRRVLQQVEALGQGGASGGAMGPGTPVGGEGRAKARLRALRPWAAYAVAAAVLLCIAVPFWVEMAGRRSGAPKTRVATATATTMPTATAPTAPTTPTTVPEVTSGPDIKDTYSDPRQALAAIRRALLIASAGINRGKHMTEKNMTRLHHTWQAAVGD